MLNCVIRLPVFSCVAAAGLSLLLPGCTRPPDDSDGQSAQPPFILLDTAEAGLDFSYINGAYGSLHNAETMGAGAALLDYDNDGDLDVYFVQGNDLRNWPGGTQDDGPTNMAHRDRLYRNDLEVTPDGTRRLHFTDVTDKSGIVATGYGMGVATGDFDNDDWQDLYVTNFGLNQLWRNAGDGTFEDVTAAAGVAGEGDAWSTSAAFLDYDGDRLPDLYVANYIAERLTDPKRCYARNSAPDYCGPDAYPGQTNRLYRNQGGGIFSDITATSGVGAVSAASLGVVAADFNNDDRQDIFVANDGMENELWINKGTGTFSEQGVQRGVAVNATGDTEASMGVSAGDFDGDGDTDLFMTHLTRESNTLYENDGRGQFMDRTIATGLAAPSLPYTGFGTAWSDYDNDGWLDLLVVNGAVSLHNRTVTPGRSPLAEPNQLFHARGDGTFEDVTALAGNALQLVEVSRGAAFGDIDNDGDTDVIITNNDGPVRVLLNQAPPDHHWLGLSLKEASPDRYALGARIAVELKGSDGETRQLWRTASTDGSYLCASDPRILVGLGMSTRIGRLRVYWPNGDVEQWEDLPVDRYHELGQGKGHPVAKDET